MLEPIASFPFHAVVVILILIAKLDSDLVVGIGEELLAETVTLLLLPLLGQEIFDGCGSGEEGCPITPYAIWGVGTRDYRWIPMTISLTRIEVEDGLLSVP